ncbi:MAG: T9SS type A sorting domain-containing protein [Ignavibacteriae bacterium]|nr:T9SS type A sorting domain-containing protein [Ignavibacteriota bacterium]
MKNNFFYPVSFCLIILLSCYNSAISRAYFVATNGDDGNDGSVNTPWRTFEFALTIVTAGDTLNIRGGNYQQSINTVNNGTDMKDGAIVIRAYNGESVLLQGIEYQGNAIVIQNSYIKLEGIEDSCWNSGMVITFPANHVEITNCKAHDMDYGISVYGGTHYITLRNCEMYRFGNFGFDATANEEIGPENEITNVTLINCYSHDADFTTPIHNPDGNADGFAFGHNNERNVTLINCTAARVGDGFDLDGNNITAINCTSHNTTYLSGGGFKCWADTVFLFNCLSYNNISTGIELDQNDANVPINKMTVTNVINCTAVDNGSNNVSVEGTTKKLNMFNSLIVGGIEYTPDVVPKGLVFMADSHATYTGDYNIINSTIEFNYINDVKGEGIDYNSDMLADWQASSGQDAHSYFVKNIDSMFVNRQGQDFHLRSGSFPIDKGSSANGYSYDHDSIQRDATPDIGCYEYNPGSSVDDDNANNFQSLFTFFSNSTSKDLNIYFYLTEDNSVDISIYDISGKPSLEPVKTKWYSIGGHTLNVDCGGLSSGAYIVVLKYQGKAVSSKFII